ncbi:MAG: putative membrane protein, partial [Paraglaciecola sp.]
STLMLFMEGMLNGMTITLLIIYRPEWVYTFYDKIYLEKK